MMGADEKARPMHLALVATFYYPRLLGGAEHTLHQHAETLARRGLRVSVLSLHDGAKPERFVHNGVECHALPAPNLKRCLDRTNRAPAALRSLWHVLDVYNPAAGSLLERELRSINPDLVHTETLPGWSCAAWTAARRFGRPHVQMLHDYQLTCPSATRFRSGRNCEATCASCQPFSALRRRFSQRVTHVIANSRYTRKVHQDLGFFSGAEVFDVIYGPVPPPRGDAAGGTISRALRVGYMGRLHPTKGVGLLIEAFMAAGRKDAVLRIAGNGTPDYEAELRGRAAGGAVEFLGHTPAEQFLAGIDVLVVPSLWNEPMGRVVIEAASHGVPVIAAARGGIPELVEEERTGWLFDPAEPAQLTDLLRTATVDGLRASRDECLAFARRFRPDVIADQWLTLYSKMLGAKHARSAAVTAEPVAAAGSW